MNPSKIVMKLSTAIIFIDTLYLCGWPPSKSADRTRHHFLVKTLIDLLRHHEYHLQLPRMYYSNQFGPEFRGALYALSVHFTDGGQDTFYLRACSFNVPDGPCLSIYHTKFKCVAELTEEIFAIIRKDCI
jgi:hypothetical protein